MYTFMDNNSFVKHELEELLKYKSRNVGPPPGSPTDRYRTLLTPVIGLYTRLEIMMYRLYNVQLIGQNRYVTIIGKSNSLWLYVLYHRLEEAYNRFNSLSQLVYQILYNLRIFFVEN